MPESLSASDFAKPKILDLFQEHRIAPRADSAAFLIWFLENYYRLDPTEAIDAVTDRGGDKGIDGIFVNDSEESITIFASRIFDDASKEVGDKALLHLAGAISQFRDRNAVENLIATGGDARVAQLAKRAEVPQKLADGYSVQGIFLTNALLHKNGKDFLDGAPDLRFIGQKYLIERFVSGARTKPIHKPIKFNVRGLQAAQYSVEDIKTLIVPVKASELIKMSGIANQSLFQPNVRGPLGKTAVNKAVIASVRSPKEHKWFPLFHNGVTIIANKVGYKSGMISVEDYFVVNGCQSITALFENGASITPDLKILAKFIEVPPESAIAETITRFSNNQNGITARDFKSNHKIQVQIQNMMRESYHGSFYYQVKRGEEKSAGPTEKIIQNSDAGLLIMAFDLKQPWATHRSYQVFEEKHAEVFGRPSVTAHKIVMLAVINEVVKTFNVQIKNALFAQYRITTYFLIYVLRLILEQEEIATSVFDYPEMFVSTATLRSKFAECIGTIMKGLIVDLNYDLQIITANSVDFDYRDSLRDKKWVEDISNGFLKSRIKDTTTGKSETFSAEWNRLNSM